jgi:Icc-related predicted phosphoesterase
VTRIICVGDIHAMDRAPRNATESYMDDIIDMLRWVAEEAVRQEAAAVVWAGDIFHHKQPSKTSHALVLRMIEVVRYHEKLDIELYAVTGNHDISNDVLQSIPEKQPLGVLYEAGLQELVGWHESLPIFGVPWRHDWTTSETAAWEAFEGYRNGVEWRVPHTVGLAVTHAPIYPPKEAENIQWELVPTMGDQGISKAMGNTGFLYYGHIHEDHGVFEVEGTTYANMGAISRGSLTEYNVQRQIKVALWDDGVSSDAKLGGDPAGFTEIVVPHKPAHEVLRVAEVAVEKADKLSLDSFLSEVGSSTLDISSTGTVIAHIQGRKDVDAKVRKTAIEILEEVG